MKMNRFFAPAINSASADLGLLILRIWFGGTMLLIHGWDKVAHFSDKAKDFPDLLHVGSPTANLVLAIFAEVVCAALLVTGFVTRFAALTLAINMAVAFALVRIT